MKRYRDALFIQEGACNPSGVAISIIDACREFREQNPNKGTLDLRRDPAIRLMVHQLAHLCGVCEIDNEGDVYGQLMEQCRQEVPLEDQPHRIHQTA